MKNKDIKKDFVEGFVGFCILKGEESIPTLCKRVVLYFGEKLGKDAQALRKQA